MSFLTLLFVREEEKSVKQVLSDMLTCLGTCLKEGILLLTRSLRTLAKTLVIIVAGLSSFGIAKSYLAHEQPAVTVLSSLLSGFAPLIGLSVLIIIISVLISFLICTVERTLAEEDGGFVPGPYLKSKWHGILPCLPDQLAHCLSLKEHSPPLLRFS